MSVPRSRFALLISAFATAGVLAFLWTPMLWLYGAALWEALATKPARLLEALPLALIPRTLFLNTLFLCAATVLLSLLLGGIVAAFLARQKRFGGALIFFVLPLAVSPTLMATVYLEISRTPPARAAASLGAEHTLSFNSIFIAAPVLAFCFYPLVALGVAAARRAIPTELTDAARLLGSDWNMQRRVLLPLLAPAALACAGIVAALAMWEMGAPDLLDVRSYSVQIYRDFSAQQNTTKAALDALPMFFLGALCFLPAWRALRFYKGLEMMAFAAPSSGRQGKALAAGAGFIFLLSPLAPLAVFISQMQPPQILGEIWDVNHEEIVNTLMTATISSMGIIAIGLALVVCWQVYSIRVRQTLLALCLGSLLCAPIMLAVAYLVFYNQAIFDGITNSRYGLLVLGVVARFAPLGILWLYEAVRRIPLSSLEAATGLGASPGKVLSSITMPLLAPALLGLFAVSWALCAGELSLSVLLNAPGGQTLPVPIFNQMHIGATAEVAAISLTLVALCAAVLGLILASAFWLRQFQNRVLH